jgi:hypothetical protein
MHFVSDKSLRRPGYVYNEHGVGYPVEPDMRLHHLKFRWIFRIDEIQRFLRIARIVWQRGTVGDGHGYSAKFSVALRTKPLELVRRDATTDWRVTLFFVRLHYCRSYGGIMP